MPAERFFFDGSLETKVEIEDQEFHHLKHVMRIREGETVEVVNGAGALAEAVVARIAKDRAVLEINHVETIEKPSQEVILAQALPRSSRLDFILEKGTELGVTQFWLFPSHHSPKKDPSENQLARMQTLTVAAMKQCGSLYLPKIVMKPPLDDWENIDGSAFFGDVRPSAPMFLKTWNESAPRSPIMFFVGPESGFTDDEVEWFDQHRVKGVKLHRNILRTETAAIVALSLIETALLHN